MKEIINWDDFQRVDLEECLMIGFMLGEQVILAVPDQKIPHSASLI